MKGIIFKGIGGFYYVKMEDGIIRCRARGILRERGLKPFVGDEVVVSVQENGDAAIEEILPRKNFFTRPPVANIDLMVVVAAAARPKPNIAVIDRFLTASEYAGIETVLCVNKIDLAEREHYDRLINIYGAIMRVFPMCAKAGDGTDALKDFIKGRKAAFAGPSGVGKSTILNCLHPEALAETGAVSGKTERGRHTTRSVEIFETDSGGMIFDTPGFTSFDTPDMEPAELKECFPEIARYSGKCRYDDCAHISEPGCEVISALERGEISTERYGSYTSQYEELLSKKRY